jgi:hypothetical protein
VDYKPDDIEYAIENSYILREPYRRIDTFGVTLFKFIALSQLMDDISTTRIRVGQVEAQKPQIIKPNGYNEVTLEGFDKKARDFLNMLFEKGLEPAIFQYGFQFSRGEVSEELVHENIENVKHRILEQVRKDDDPMLAVIECVDNTWEVGLLKFSIDMIKKSSEINAFDFKRKGLL